MTFESPESVSLAGLFAHRIFVIPNYQRAYSWEKKHRNDLFNDIKCHFDNKNEKDKIHFMATVVGLKRNTLTIAATEYKNIDIVDGQQRITTLIILCKAIFKELNHNDEQEKIVKRTIGELLVKPDKHTTLLLQNNHDNNTGHFSQYIRTGKYDSLDQAETRADRNILDAINECEKFVKEWKSNNRVLDLFAYIYNKIYFVYHEILQENLVYSVFELLNSRGLQVSHFDLLKTSLMDQVFREPNAEQLLKEVHNGWSKIFRTIGVLPIDDEVLRFAATLYQHEKSRIRSEESSKKYLAERTNGEGDKILETIEWLNKIAKAVCKIRINKKEEAVNKTKQARLLAIAIDLRDDLLVDDKKKLIGLYSKITFAIYCIGNKDARTAVGDYVRLAWDITNKKIPTKEIERRLYRLIDPHRKQIKEGLKYFAEDSWYPEHNLELRYLLYKYEEHLIKKAGQTMDNKNWNSIWNTPLLKTVEHILSQSTQSERVHCIGNLFLLPPGVNSKLRDKKPIEKKNEYENTGFQMSRDIVKSLSKWDDNAIIKRGKKIGKWASSEWDIQSPYPKSSGSPIKRGSGAPFKR